MNGADNFALNGYNFCLFRRLKFHFNIKISISLSLFEVQQITKRKRDKKLTKTLCQFSHCHEVREEAQFSFSETGPWFPFRQATIKKKF